MRFEIEGKIKHFLPVETYSDSNNFTRVFSKRKLLVQIDDEYVVIVFIDKKMDLLEFCSSNQIIKFFVELKVTQLKNYFINDLVCYDLKIIKTLNHDKNPIIHNNSKYVLYKSNSENILMLSLYDLETENFIDISHKHEFPNRDLNKTHILYKEESGKILLELLYRKGILNKGLQIGTESGFNGYVCEVLVNNLFNSNNFLPIHNSDSYKCKFYYTEQLYQDEIDYSNYNDDLDYDEQGDEFWNQF
jgi:hypothetical protein